MLQFHFVSNFSLSERMKSFRIIKSYQKFLEDILYPFIAMKPNLS